MADWIRVSEHLWEAVLKKVIELRQRGDTMEEIAKRVGVNNKSVISQWLKGDRKAQNTSFSLLMSYVENIGLDYHDYFPNRGRNVDSEAAVFFDMEAKRQKKRADDLEVEVNNLQVQVAQLKVFKHKWEGYLESEEARYGHRNKGQDSTKKTG